jgi:membrane associated rhomboid family serine protease
MAIYQEIKDSFKFGSALTRLLYINIGVFIVFRLIYAFYWAAGYQAQFPFFDLLSAPAYLPALLYKPWTVVSYMFYHEDFFHIAFNMLGLYWFGRIFLEFLNKKQLIGTYILGGISGYILYSLAYYTLPVLKEHLPLAKMLGASASVLAILGAVSFYRPNYSITMLFLGQVKLKYLALFYIVLDVLTMASGNAGGHIAHLGGMLFGGIFVLQLNSGKDITAGVNKILDIFVTLFKPRKKLKVSHRKPVNDYEYKKQKVSEQKEIDAILDKISRSGYDSLNKDEKEMLFKMGQNKNK